MFSNCIATITERKEDGELGELKVFISPKEFLSEHACFIDEKELHHIVDAVEGSKDLIIGMLDLASQPWQRIYYMTGPDPKRTQDELRLAVYDRNEHSTFVEKR